MHAAANGNGTKKWLVGTATTAALLFFAWQGKTLFEISKDVAEIHGALPGMVKDIDGAKAELVRRAPALSKLERVEQGLDETLSRVDRLERAQDRRTFQP